MYRPAWLSIDLDAFRYNVLKIKEVTNKKLFPIIKANAYGVGDKVISNVLKDYVDIVGVSSLSEALVLRKEGFDKEILILGYVDHKYIDLCIENDFSLTTVSKEWIKKLENVKDLKIHIKINTGMNRLGVETFELNECFNILNDKKVNIEGIFTHFACSDDLNNDMTLRQFKEFKKAVTSLDYDFKWIHCSNSDASLSFKEDFSNACRVGISLYGINSHYKKLKNVISLYCEITNVKTVKKGETISYKAVYTCEKDEIIATLPIGYADGWLRKNQSRKVWVKDTYATIVGKICMDQMMIALDKFYDVKTKVELFGKHISLDELAKDLDTIPYEIITILSDRLTREYIDNGKIIKINPRLFSVDIDED